MKPVVLLLACAPLVCGRSPLDDVLQPFAGPRSPGFAVLIRQNNRTIFQRGYGVRDLRRFDKIDARTNFRLASCTKQFTAMAIMLLVHDGKLRYDQPLTDFFPEFPAYGHAVTVRHLLNHTSGLPDYEDLMAPSWTAAHQIHDREVLALIERRPDPKFQPGTSWAYSNSGYVLLGLIVGRVSGQSFPQFLRDRIFRPLRMDHTLAYMSGVDSIPHRAYGHSKEAGGFIETDQSSTSATLGDGGVYSNLRDLAKWDAALENHSLLSEEEMKPALAPVPAQPYGFGWFLDPYQGRPRMWHFGETMGFRTVIERFAADHLTIVVLCNRTDIDPAQVALGLLPRLQLTPQPTRP